MSKIKPKWEHGNMHPDSENKVFCTAPWTHTYISPQSERRMCCASREEHQFQKQYIDARMMKVQVFTKRVVLLKIIDLLV